MPVASNENEFGRSKNRRIHVISYLQVKNEKTEAALHTAVLHALPVPIERLVTDFQVSCFFYNPQYPSSRRVSKAGSGNQGFH